MSRPTIIINDLDAERIDILLEQPAYAGLPIADALNAELDRAQMCSPEEMPHDVVTMNSRVKFRSACVHAGVSGKNDRQQYSAFRYGSGRCRTAGAARWRFHSLGTSGRRCNPP